MSDDMCRPHAHFTGAPSMTCHHFFYDPRVGEYRCMCGAQRQSVIQRDASKRLRERLPY